MSAPQATAAQVMAAMMAAGITRIDRQPCAQCGVQLSYTRVGNQLFYNSDCDQHNTPHPFSWQDAADWVNLTRDPTNRTNVAAKFGLSL